MRQMARMGGRGITCLRAAIAGLCLLMSFAASARADTAGSSAASYRAQVNKLCASANSQIEALPASDASSIAGSQKQLSIDATTLSHIKAVPIPSSLRSAVTKWLADVEHVFALSKKVVSDLQAGDVSAAESLVAQGKATDAASHAAATSLRLPDCAKSAVRPSGNSGSSATPPVPKPDLLTQAANLTLPEVHSDDLYWQPLLVPDGVSSPSTQVVLVGCKRVEPDQGSPIVSCGAYFLWEWQNTDDDNTPIPGSFSGSVCPDGRTVVWSYQPPAVEPWEWAQVGPLGANTARTSLTASTEG